MTLSTAQRTLSRMYITLHILMYVRAYIHIKTQFLEAKKKKKSNQKN